MTILFPFPYSLWCLCWHIQQHSKTTPFEFLVGLPKPFAHFCHTFKINTAPMTSLVHALYLSYDSANQSIKFLVRTLLCVPLYIHVPKILYVMFLLQDMFLTHLMMKENIALRINQKLDISIYRNL